MIIGSETMVSKCSLARWCYGCWCKSFRTFKVLWEQCIGITGYRVSRCGPPRAWHAPAWHALPKHFVMPCKGCDKTENDHASKRKTQHTSTVRAHLDSFSIIECYSFRVWQAWVKLIIQNALTNNTYTKMTLWLEGPKQLVWITQCQDSTAVLRFCLDSRVFCPPPPEPINEVRY